MKYKISWIVKKLAKYADIFYIWIEIYIMHIIRSINALYLNHK